MNDVHYETLALKRSGVSPYDHHQIRIVSLVGAEATVIAITGQTGMNVALPLPAHAFGESFEQHTGSKQEGPPVSNDLAEKVNMEASSLSEFSPRKPDEGATGLMRHVSLETLNPVHDSGSRKSSLMVGIVSLIATVCGGGVLSLPLVFRKAGIIPTTFLMIYGVVTTNFSLHILVSCARRMGGRSYGDVAKAAFGSTAEVATTSLMAVMLVGSLTAYSVLVMDTWSPLVLASLPNYLRDFLMGTIPTAVSTATSANSTIDVVEVEDTASYVTPSKRASAIILACIMLLSLSLLLQRDLHSLRHTCYVGFCSCILLMVAIVVRASQAIQLDDNRPPINWYSTDIADLSFAFPIVVLCFLCSYNALGIHSSLVDPTRERVNFVLDSSMVVCFALFYLVGLGGYIYAMDETLDNILLNFRLNDAAILIGRIGFCFTLFFGIPLVLLPCRAAWLDIWPQIIAWKADSMMIKEFMAVRQRSRDGAHFVINRTPLLVTEGPQEHYATMFGYGSDHHVEDIVGGTADNRIDDDREILMNAGMNKGVDLAPPHQSSKLRMYCITVDGEDEDNDCQKDDVMTHQVAHFSSTFAIMGFCYFAAISVPGVGFVWRLLGSSMAILISFIIPSACYLKICDDKRCDPRSIAAWTILIISLIAAPICTMQALSQNT